MIPGRRQFGALMPAAPYVCVHVSEREKEKENKKGIEKSREIERKSLSLAEADTYVHM